MRNLTVAALLTLSLVAVACSPKTESEAEKAGDNAAAAADNAGDAAASAANDAAANTAAAATE